MSRSYLAASAALLLACENAGPAAPAPTAAAPSGNPASASPETPASNPARLASPMATAIGGNNAMVPLTLPAAMSSAAVTPVAGAAAATPVSDSAPIPSGPSGFTTDPDTGELVFRTDPVKVESGTEAYICYAATLEQEEVIDGFAKGPQRFVHHIQFAKTLDGAEPSGLSECNVLFKVTWMPIFLTGAGASELRLEEGVGHKLPAGTQLVAQLHLLNAGDKDIDQQVEIRMHRSTATDPIPVNTWAVGSADINVAPRQAGRAQNLCRVAGNVDLVAAFPHMHMIGTRLEVEAGKTADSLSQVYLRDPYDFDDQHMENFKLSLQDGDMVRVTCDYMNTNDGVAEFGESSHDEMCFFIGFAIGDPPLADCPGLWDTVLTKLF